MSANYINWSTDTDSYKKSKKLIPYRNGNFKDFIENELRRRAREKFEDGSTLASDIPADELDYYSIYLKKPDEDDTYISNPDKKHISTRAINHNCKELIDLYLDIGNTKRTETGTITYTKTDFHRKLKEMSTVDLVELLRNLEERTDKNYGHDYFSGEHLRM